MSEPYGDEPWGRTSGVRAQWPPTSVGHQDSRRVDVDELAFTA